MKLTQDPAICKPRIVYLNSKGQVLIEFILLLVVVFSLSLILLKGFNTGIATRWIKAVTLIVNPPGTPPSDMTNIEFP